MAKILGREKSCLQVCHFIVGIGVGAGTEYERPDWLISASPPLKRKTTFTKQIRKKSMKTKVKNSYDDCPYNISITDPSGLYSVDFLLFCLPVSYYHERDRF